MEEPEVTSTIYLDPLNWPWFYPSSSWFWKNKTCAYSAKQIGSNFEESTDFTYIMNNCREKILLQYLGLVGTYMADTFKQCYLLQMNVIETTGGGKFMNTWVTSPILCCVSRCR